MSELARVEVQAEKGKSVAHVRLTGADGRVIVLPVFVPPEDDSGLVAAFFARVLGEPPAWTAEPPTAPGWYWWDRPVDPRDGAAGPPQVVRVIRDESPSGRVKWCAATTADHDHDWVDLAAEPGGSWLGPIPAPDAP